MTERSWYEPVKDHPYTDDVPGFDADLLQDLHDCIRCFGAPTDERNEGRRLSFDGPGTVPVYAFGNVVPHDKVMIFVSRTQFGIDAAGARTLYLSAPQSSAVVIGKDVTAEDVRGLVTHVDGMMRRAGMFRSDGSRMTVMHEKVAKFEVAKVLPNPGDMLTVEDGVHPAELHARFDRPDDVIPIVVIRKEKGTSFMAFIRTDDTSMRSRVKATMRVAEEWGFSRPNEILKYDMDGMARFFADVHERLIAVDD